MLPYPKVAPYFDSMPLFEQESWAAGTFVGRTFDVVDFLTAIHDSTPPAGTRVHEAISSDARFVVSWFVQGAGWTLDFTGVHSRAHFILEGGAGGFPVFVPRVMHYVPLAEPVATTVGLASVVNRELSGTLRANARFLRCTLVLSGNAPGSFRFGAYFRCL